MVDADVKSCVTVLLTTTAALCIINASAGCPIMCECRWKKGKQTVECIDKGLITIPVNIDPGTQVLSIGGNNIRIIPAAKFKTLGLINLQRIHMPECQIFEIDDRAFMALTNLIELDLSKNQLSVLPSAIFRDTPSLMQLSVSGNPVTEVRKSTFENLPYLATLDLSHCQLKTIENGAFENLPKLQWLQLNDNELTTLSSDGLLLTLHGLELQNNKWKCDCQLRSLRSWLQAYKMPPAVEPKCASPPEMNGVPVREARREELACSPQITTLAETLEVPEGKNVSLTCRAHADPPANISWHFNGSPLDITSDLDYMSSEFSDESSISRQSELIIWNTSVVHQGVFSCNASNPAGNALVNFTLRILLPPDSSRSETAPVEPQYSYLMIIMVSLVVTIALMTMILFAVVIRWCTCSRRKAKSVQNGRSNTSTNNSEVYNANYTAPIGSQMGSSSLHSSVSQSTTFTDCKDGVSFIAQYHTSDRNPDLISLCGQRQFDTSNLGRRHCEEIAKRSVRFAPRTSYEDLRSNFIKADVHETSYHQKYGKVSATLSRSHSHHHKFNQKSELEPDDFRSLPRRSKSGKPHCITYTNNPNSSENYPHLMHVLPEQPVLIESMSPLANSQCRSLPVKQEQNMISFCHTESDCKHDPQSDTHVYQRGIKRYQQLAPLTECHNSSTSQPLHPPLDSSSSPNAGVCYGHMSSSPDNAPQLSPPAGFSDPHPPDVTAPRGDPNCSGLPDPVTGASSMASPASGAILINKMNIRVQGMLCPPHESPDEGYDETAGDSADV